MSDEDFVTGDGRMPVTYDDDVEEMLEILMRSAQSEGREFLAYLLGMALMEAATNRLRRPIFRINRRNWRFASL